MSKHVCIVLLMFMVASCSSHINPDQTIQCATMWSAGLAEQASAGDFDALNQLAIAYEKGCGVPKDVEKAFELNMAAAKRGNVEAQIVVAQKYSAGDGVLQNQLKAARWLRKARSAGSEIASHLLDQYYAQMALEISGANDVQGLVAGAQVLRNEGRSILLAEEMLLHAKDVAWSTRNEAEIKPAAIALGNLYLSRQFRENEDSLETWSLDEAMEEAYQLFSTVASIEKNRKFELGYALALSGMAKARYNQRRRPEVCSILQEIKSVRDKLTLPNEYLDKFYFPMAEICWYAGGKTENKER